MLFDPPPSPQPYSDDVETIGEDEAKLTQELGDTLLKIAEKTYEDGGHAIRAVHAKSHGLLSARFEVLPGLPAVLAQGLFARPATYDAVMRFSTTPGDMLDDSVSTPRGVAVKVLGVAGARAPGASETTTQDFLMVNGKLFNAPNAKAFLANLKLLAATTDKGDGLKKVLSGALRGLERGVEALGGKSATLVSLGGHPETHILGEHFFAQLPVRYGDYIAKLSIVPVSPELTALTNQPLDVNGKPDGLREAVTDFFAANGGEWEFRVQLCTNLADMPVEDATAPWDEAQSHFITVARLTVAPQTAWSEARSETVDDGMGFSPWNTLAAHRPLGSIMRLRREPYIRSQDFRSQRNRCPVREPASAAL